MGSDPPELGKGLFGYRKSVVNQIIADRDIMLRQAEGRVRAAESKVADLESEMHGAKEKTARMEEQLERLRTQFDTLMSRGDLATAEDDSVEEEDEDTADDDALEFAVQAAPQSSTQADEDAPDEPVSFAPAEDIFGQRDEGGQAEPVALDEFADDSEDEYLYGPNDFTYGAEPAGQTETQQEQEPAEPVDEAEEPLPPMLETGMDLSVEEPDMEAAAAEPETTQAPSPEREPAQASSVTERFLTQDLAGILRAAEESAARIVERAQESTERQIQESNRLWQEVQSELSRFAAWRENVDPLIRSVHARIQEVKASVEDVPERIRQALAPMADAISSIDADLGDLGSAWNPPLLLTPSSLEAEGDAEATPDDRAEWVEPGRGFLYEAGSG
jgi:archaellum component FlaC